jgi:hypothetical protein
LLGLPLVDGRNYSGTIHVFGVRSVKRIGTIDALFAIQNKCRRPLNEVIKRGQSTNLDRLSHPPNQGSERGWITKHLRIRSGANFSDSFDISKKISK